MRHYQYTAREAALQRCKRHKHTANTTNCLSKDTYHSPLTITPCSSPLFAEQAHDIVLHHQQQLTTLPVHAYHAAHPAIPLHSYHSIINTLTLLHHTSLTSPTTQLATTLQNRNTPHPTRHSNTHHSLHPTHHIPTTHHSHSIRLPRHPVEGGCHTRRQYGRHWWRVRGAVCEWGGREWRWGEGAVCGDECERVSSIS